MLPKGMLFYAFLIKALFRHKNNEEHN